MEEDKSFLKFPDSFEFGTSVASFQVEDNLSQERQTDWDTFLGVNQDQIIRPGEVGPTWWNDESLINSDLKTISELGVSLQRLSLEWARIEPEQGKINQEALRKYHLILETCKKYSLTPILTINHFSLPEWVAKNGGWENPKIVDHLLNFTNLLLAEFGDVQTWVIINEPSNLIYIGHLLGIFPPNKKSLLSTLRARNNVIKAQQKIYTLIKSTLPKAEVGNAFSFLWLRSHDRNSKLETTLTAGLNYLVNTNFVSATADYMDFLGMNFYTGYYIDMKLTNFSTTMRNEAAFMPHHLPFAKTVRPKTYKTDMGWPIVPDFFLDVLKHMHQKYKKPILITENGLADRDDVYRPFYILSHLTALWQAMAEGVEIKGYIHWATIDNLEWVEGFAKRFGLIEIDPFTGKRQVRVGAKVYESIIKNKGIHIDQLIENYVPAEQKVYVKQVIDQLLQSTDTVHPRISKNK